MESKEFEIGEYVYTFRRLTHGDQTNLERKWKIIRLSNKIIMLSERLDNAEKRGKIDRMKELIDELDALNDLYYNAIAGYNADRIIQTCVSCKDKNGNEVEVNDEFLMSIPDTDFHEIINAVFAWQNGVPENIFEDIVKRFEVWLYNFDDDTKIPISLIRNKWKELLELEISGNLKKKS